MMISMELLAAPARRLWSRCIQHRSSLRDFAASFQLFYHRRIFSSTFLLICNKNPLYHHDFQCLKISVRWSITLLRKPCCRSKPPPRAWLSEGTRIPGPLIKRANLDGFLCSELLWNTRFYGIFASLCPIAASHAFSSCRTFVALFCGTIIGTFFINHDKREFRIHNFG